MWEYVYDNMCNLYAFCDIYLILVFRVLESVCGRGQLIFGLRDLLGPLVPE